MPHSWCLTVSLHDALPIFEADKVYAPSDFVDVEQVMQQIINDHVTPAPPSIDVPMPIVGRQVKAYTTEWQSVWDAGSEEHTSELKSRGHIVCRRLLEKKNQ